MKMTTIELKHEIDNYVDSLDRKEITKSSYRGILYRWASYLKSKRIYSPNKRDIIAYKEKLAKSLGSASVQKTVVVLRGFYKYLKLADKYDDITYGVRGAKVEKTFKRNPLEVDEIIKLISKASEESNKSISSYRNYAIVTLMATTGMRTIEVVRANISDLMIHKNKSRLYIQGKGRDGKDEYVKLSPDVYEIINNYLSQRNDSYDPLFISHKGNVGSRLTTRTIRGIIKDLLRAIDIDDKRYSAHSLRHSLATILIKNANGTISEAQQILRHKDISTTEIYNHALQREDNDGEIRVSNLLLKGEIPNDWF